MTANRGSELVRQPTAEAEEGGDTDQDPTGKGRKRWTMRWKAPLNAFQIAFEGRLTPSNN
ncbi:hypothetical protein GCM10010521_61170 [Streptomyces rameus]|uniref:Uncharacterized protein n=1 Tax=Streptomyces rameus TaxID=68261 RepID=A0ABN3V1Z7_9ACTN